MVGPASAGVPPGPGGFFHSFLLRLNNPGLYLALFLSTLAVYSQVRDFAFVNYDDPVYVSRNPHVRGGLTLDGLKWALTSGEGANWFPVTRLSHLLDAQLFGMESGWHHLDSLLIHALAVLLLFAFLYGLTGARWRSAMVAFLFAVHPLHVESVAWVSERKDVLCAFFWMLALGAYVRSRPAAVLAAFCLGLMSKPMIVTLPLVLTLVDVWRARQVANGCCAAGQTTKCDGLPHEQAARPTPIQTISETLRLAPFFALSGAAAIATYLVQQASGAVRTFNAFPLAWRIENALVSYVVYIAKFLWPAGLAVFYPYPQESQLWPAILAAVVLGGISLAVVRGFARHPYLAVGWFWYLVTLTPVIGIIQVGGQARADRYMYVPMIGLAIMVVWGAADLLAGRPRLIAALAGVACIGCVVLTWRQTGYWRDSVSLFQHAVDVTERNDVAQHNLGNALLEIPGRLPDAVAHLEAALAINPESAGAHTDLGIALSQMPGRLPDAIAQYRAAVRIDPNLPIPHADLGTALLNAGAIAEATTECQTALRLDPDFAQARDCLNAAEANPAETQFSMAMALAKTPGRLPEAIAHFEAALRIDPKNAEAQNNLGFALTSVQGRLPEAISHFEAALKINPDYADAHYNLGVALANLGRIPEAIRHLEAAERLKPDPELEQLIRRLKAG